MFDTRPRPLLVLALLVSWGLVAWGEEESRPPANVVEPPSYDQFLVIPLRVHLLQADDLPQADCALTDSDIERIVAKLNRIWNVAGIHWGLESIVREPAARQDRFRRNLDRQGLARLDQYRLLIPEESRHFAGLHIYVIHSMPVNGVYFNEDYAFVQETAQLLKVDGGVDEPLPRVLAHELGHALGLPHRQDRTNLLASGTTGILLNTAEVDRARAHARRTPGASPVAAVRAAADQAADRGDPTTARRLWSWLSQVPGPPAAEARARRDALSGG